MLRDFKAFVLRGNVLDLAVAVIIGTSFGKIVTSLVNDIIMPPVGMLLGGVDFADLKIVLKAAAGDKPEVAIAYGAFTNTLIAFIVIAFVVWRISKVFIKEAPAAAPAPTKACPYCREANAVDASKCRACASAI